MAIAPYRSGSGALQSRESRDRNFGQVVNIQLKQSRDAQSS
jgi:hypothetical protein